MLRLKNGHEKLLIGPWSSRPASLKRYTGIDSVDVILKTSQNESSLSGAVSIGFAQSAYDNFVDKNKYSFTYGKLYGEEEFWHLKRISDSQELEDNALDGDLARAQGIVAKMRPLPGQIEPEIKRLFP